MRETLDFQRVRDNVWIMSLLTTRMSEHLATLNEAYNATVPIRTPLVVTS